MHRLYNFMMTTKEFIQNTDRQVFENYYLSHYDDEIMNHFGISYAVFKAAKDKWKINKRPNKLPARIKDARKFKFYTDGKTQVRVYDGDQIPDGFVAGGISKSAETCKRISEARKGKPAHNKGKVVVNNGVQNIYVDPNSEEAKTYSKGSTKVGRKAYHNEKGQVKYFEEAPNTSEWISGDLAAATRVKNSQTQKKNNIIDFAKSNNYTKRKDLIDKYGWSWISAKWFYNTLKEIWFDNVCFFSAEDSEKIAEFKADKGHNEREYIEQFEQKNNCTNLNKLLLKYGQLIYILDLPKITDGKFKFIDNKYLPDIEKAYRNRSVGISDAEKELLEFIKSQYNGKIETNTRSIIKNEESNYGLELDIYLPEKHLAFEFNGTYWHSSQADTPKDYHFKKSLLCAEKDIRLIHIYQDEWINKKEKIKQLIRIALGTVANKIYARNCDIREISNKEAEEFSNKTHLQGHRNASITYGLFYRDELVQLMSFSKTTDAKRNGAEWEIIRGCPGSNNIVVGGVSKLFKYFIKTNKPKSIFSYCDFNKFNGKSYEQLEMKFIGYTGPDKYWIINDRMIPRSPTKYQELKKEAQGVLWGSGSKKYLWEDVYERY